MISPRRKLISAIAATAMAFTATSANACTSFMLKAQNGDVVYGRTLEFSLKLDSQLIIIPRNFDIKGTGPDGQEGSGLAFKTKYGVTGANGLGQPLIVDGINEKGLSAGLQWFPALSEFQDVTAADARNSIASYELATYVLTQFASVDEVKAGLQKIKVNRSAQAQLKAIAPVHMSVHDASGKSIVVEYVGGELQITDNPTTVMTNAPSIGWHLGSLSLYANASAQPAPAFTINGASYPQWSTGSGMKGLPGDMSSQSRFVRAAFLVANAPAIKDAAEGLPLAYHLLNQFDIPPGSSRTVAGGNVGGGVAGYEVTEWTSAADLTHGIYQIKTYDNSEIRQVSLKSADLDAKEIRFIPIDQKPIVTDLTNP